MMYCSENQGWMVCRAGTGDAGWVSGAPSKSDATTFNGVAAPDHTGNWIAWYYVLDPFTGLQSGFGLPNGTTSNDQNLSYSAIAKYLGIPYTVTSYNGAGGLPVSNAFNSEFSAVFTCPGDDVQSRQKSQLGVLPSNQKNFYYSYSMNDYIDNPPENPGGGTPVNARSWGVFTGKITSIRNSADIVMFVCEDNQTLDDGVFSINANNWVNNVPVNTLSTRHYGVSSTTVSVGLGQNVNQDGYGNASFCDGHAEVTSRKDVFRQAHSGSNLPDPPGF